MELREVDKLICKKIVLYFPQHLVDQPIVHRLGKDFQLAFNILKAYITPREEGVLVLEVDGEPRNYDKGLEYLAKSGVRVKPLAQDVVHRKEKCIHCGVCIPICPTGALRVTAAPGEVGLDKEKCIACELCVNVCPYRAMEITF